jgi:hypothetical protein
MSGAQPSTKCRACNRVTATHAAGCSLVECPNRRPEIPFPAEGLQGFAGSLAEDRLVRRRAEKSDSIPVDIKDL